MTTIPKRFWHVAASLAVFYYLGLCFESVVADMGGGLLWSIGTGAIAGLLVAGAAIKLEEE